MVINHILDNGKSGFMGFANEMFVGIRTAIDGFNCKNVGWVISPGIVTGKFSNWHDLNGVDS